MKFFRRLTSGLFAGLACLSFGVTTASARWEKLYEVQGGGEGNFLYSIEKVPEYKKVWLVDDDEQPLYLFKKMLSSSDTSKEWIVQKGGHGSRVYSIEKGDQPKEWDIRDGEGTYQCTFFVHNSGNVTAYHYDGYYGEHHTIYSFYPNGEGDLEMHDAESSKDCQPVYILKAMDPDAENSVPNHILAFIGWFVDQIRK